MTRHVIQKRFRDD